MAPSRQDFRRASEPELLDAIRGGEGLALAEAYHRVVPAAHAVARRLMAGATEVEDVLLEVFTQLWETPPAGAPLEGWTRRTTWGVAADLLRRGGTSPSSPSASGLLPDLPAPDVRFLDAAERAIGELPDDERRALLLAHDKGVATDAQDPGAGQALVRALLSLAGPETSSADRAALHEDGCDDLVGLGDWCLGVADSATAAAVEEAIASRPGCAARSRAVRRGRRRVEGLPATPDMGQRILVTILTSSAVGAAAPAAAAAPIEATPAEATPAGAAPAGAMPAEAAPAPAEPSPLDEPAPVEEALPAAEPDVPVPPMDATGPMPAVDLDEDPFAPPIEPAAGAPDAGLDAGPGMAAAAADGLAAETDPMAPETDPMAPAPVEATGPMPMAAASTDAVADTADLPAADPVDWTPQPGDTSEMRLSDILAGEEDEDDPFAGLDEPDDDPAPDPYAALDGPDGPPAADPSNPYAALQDLDDDGAPTPALGGLEGGTPAFSDPAAAPAFTATGDTEVYVEGQALPEPEPEPAGAGGGLAAVLLSWILPILGGAALGILLAVQVLGPPS